MPWTGVHQAPLSMGFLRQEYWSGLPFPSSEDLPDPGIEPVSPAWQVDSLPLSHLGSPKTCCLVTLKYIGMWYVGLNLVSWTPQKLGISLLFSHDAPLWSSLDKVCFASSLVSFAVYSLPIISDQLKLPSNFLLIMLNSHSWETPHTFIITYIYIPISTIALSKLSNNLFIYHVVITLDANILQ